MQTTTQTLTVLMENHAGALSCLVGLFAQRALNIDSLTVLATEEDETLSKLTLTSRTEQQTMKAVAKQVDRLVDVISVELSGQDEQALSADKAAA